MAAPNEQPMDTERAMRIDQQPQDDPSEAMQHYQDAYARLRSDPVARNQFREELGEWDGTLADGLDDEDIEAGSAQADEWEPVDS